ncbi:cell division cycle-associated protein 3 [Austrofundulus limnaeus]|uniref:Cell division cycle-associated protein 3 n=1 Tax=Austrofundulus limnaeus TaxID=52670 RepID=A0A2I4BMG0_AUSLI|nr:PREDICTED: cell division cycle-associated protein 3 [Austrofundulus limnaeus]
MGSSESKMTAATKAEPVLKKTHVSRLIDPRSPTAGVDRTPIQVCEQESKTSEVKSECPLAVNDPRSPSVGISRTPMREVMRLTVGSFARRLGMLFHNEAEGKVHEDPPKSSDSVEEVLGNEELASTVPLLTPQSADNFDSLAEHANLLATPVQLPLQIGNSSPFVLLEQVEVEVETEPDISLEEAEEARESPLHKRLSMSLITCHEGATSTQIFAEVHQENTASPEPTADVEPLSNGVDHSYALPAIAVEPEPRKTVENSPVPQEAGKLPSEETTGSSSEQVKTYVGIRCPTFDTKSPSQLEFKPQWLGKGFGATGLRARGVQGNAGKSPLALRVAVKNATNENKGPSGKLKQKDSEGRSPLQILNSPRDQRSQMNLKVSNLDKQRLGQMDRRVLAVCLDKENR